MGESPRPLDVHDDDSIAATARLRPRVARVDAAGRTIEVVLARREVGRLLRGPAARAAHRLLTRVRRRRRGSAVWRVGRRFSFHALDDVELTHCGDDVIIVFLARRDLIEPAQIGRVDAALTQSRGSSLQLRAGSEQQRHQTPRRRSQRSHRSHRCLQPRGRIRDTGPERHDQLAPQRFGAISLARLHRLLRPRRNRRLARRRRFRAPRLLRHRQFLPSLDNPGPAA